MQIWGEGYLFTTVCFYLAYTFLKHFIFYSKKSKDRAINDDDKNNSKQQYFDLYYSDSDRLGEDDWGHFVDIEEI
jgi:hypothetical protein